MSEIKTYLNTIKGYFKAEAVDYDGNVIYDFEDDNKIVLGAGRLIARLLANKTQDWAPTSSSFGITKFVLFGIDSLITTPNCINQMLAGDFGTDYDSLNPTTLTQVNNITFPCLRESDTIEVTSIPVNDCASLATPVIDGTSVMSSDVIDNSVAVCVRIGPGYAAAGNRKYYAMAALVGRTGQSTDLNEYILAIEQFPVMIKTPAVTFRFLWTVYI